MSCWHRRLNHRFAAQQLKLLARDGRNGAVSCREMPNLVGCELPQLGKVLEFISDSLKHVALIFELFIVESFTAYASYLTTTFTAFTSFDFFTAFTSF